MNSSKSSVAMLLVSMPCPASSWLADCESMKAILACGIEKRHLNSVRHLGSPVMSDSRKHCQMPTRPCRLHTRIHCLKPRLSVIFASLASPDVALTYQACSFLRYSSSTCRWRTNPRDSQDLGRGPGSAAGIARARAAGLISTDRAASKMVPRTAMTVSSSMTVSRNATDVSRGARGSTSSSIMRSRHSGRWTTARLLPKLPCVGSGALEGDSDEHVEEL
eukprot:990734-Prymnesium_polylepis.1